MEITQIAFFIAVMFVVLALILVLAWVARRFLGGGNAPRSKGSPLRRRERRLGVVEAASISPRHKLVLVRRDDVEHLLLLGGGSELVVESRIRSHRADDDAGPRGQEPQFGRTLPHGDSLGTPAPGPALSRAAAPAFPPTTYGAATASNYEPSLYRRDDDDTRSDFGDEADKLSRPGSERSEPDYFASVRADTAAGDQPSYLDTDEPADPAPASTYEKYRPSYGTRAGGNEEPEDGNADSLALPDEEDGDDQKQSRILSRFLRKDSTE